MRQKRFRQILSSTTRQKLNCHIPSKTTRQIQWDKCKKWTHDFVYYNNGKIQQETNINFKYYKPLIPIKTTFRYGKPLVLSKRTLKYIWFYSLDTVFS